MEITSPEAMAKFADDVRAQEEPFIKAATETFASLYRAEYRRLRAAALESGENSATLQVTLRCNFDPNARSLDMQSAPSPSQPKAHRKAVAVVAVK